MYDECTTHRDTVQARCERLERELADLREQDKGYDHWRRVCTRLTDDNTRLRAALADDQADDIAKLILIWSDNKSCREIAAGILAHLRKAEHALGETP